MLRGFKRQQEGKADVTWGLITRATQVTTSSFELYLMGDGTKVYDLEVVWVACAAVTV